MKGSAGRRSWRNSSKLTPEHAERIEFVTTFRGKQIGAGRKSVTLRIRFRAPDRTLKHDEVDVQMEQVMNALKSAFDAELLREHSLRRSEWTMTAIEHMTLDELLERIGSKTPTPGGGAVASIVTALAASLARMVVAYSHGKKKLAAHEPLHAEALNRLSELTRAGDATGRDRCEGVCRPQRVVETG
jgi:hypothetical protein